MADVQVPLGFVCGSFVGFSLGLVGGGGSILAVPLMYYIVGVPTAHEAIGTFTVAVNAAVKLLPHARARTVKWRRVGVFATAGVLGAFGGSTLSKLIDGSRLLALFAVLMLVVAGVMFAQRSSKGDAAVQLNRENLPKLVASGFVTGALSGFFGIGGGFLIVPGLMLATGMPVMNAIGSSLVAVTAFGATAASNYAVSGLVDWKIAGVFLPGGVLGGQVGGRVAHELRNRRGTLNVIFAVITAAVAFYMLGRATLSRGPVDRARARPGSRSRTRRRPVRRRVETCLSHDGRPAGARWPRGDEASPLPTGLPCGGIGSRVLSAGRTESIQILVDGSSGDARGRS